MGQNPKYHPAGDRDAYEVSRDFFTVEPQKGPQKRRSLEQLAGSTFICRSVDNRKARSGQPQGEAHQKRNTRAPEAAPCYAWLQVSGCAKFRPCVAPIGK